MVNKILWGTECFSDPFPEVYMVLNIHSFSCKKGRFFYIVTPISNDNITDLKYARSLRLGLDIDMDETKIDETILEIANQHYTGKDKIEIYFGQ